MKVFFIGISILLGSVSSAGFFNKYWFPPKVRQYLIPPKYGQGACLASKHWAIKPKIVIGHKEGKAYSNYLLKDYDRHEHLQYISSYQVDNFAYKVSCR